MAAAPVLPQQVMHRVDFHDDAFKDLARLREQITKVLENKPKIVDTTLAVILCSGHMLLEDVPGVGKTTFIKAVAKLLGLEMKRIQFTADLLPSDIIGIEVFNSKSQSFTFHRGPVFANIVLADELNRASPRTQSALLEAMGEGMVTLDRQSHELPRPFIVFAAQNPSDNIGTYPLPESQLDRFSAKIRLDYPDFDQEREIFRRSIRDPLADVPEAVLGAEHLAILMDAVEAVHTAQPVADYVKHFVDATRHHEGLKLGVSTRGGVSWLRMAKARALIYSRDFVTPDDLREIALECLSHRVVVLGRNEPDQVLMQVLNSVPVE